MELADGSFVVHESSLIRGSPPTEDPVFSYTDRSSAGAGTSRLPRTSAASSLCWNAFTASAAVLTIGSSCILKLVFTRLGMPVID